jgi:hypothetical protein
MKKRIIYIITLLSFIYISASGVDISVIKTPKPKFAGFADAKRLILETSIEKTGDKNFEFFAGIKSIAVDSDCNYYIFDFRLGTIIKLNRELKFVRSITRKGEGPGEFKGSYSTPNHLSIGLDNKLYFTNLMSKKVKKFSLDGRYLGEYEFEQFKDTRIIADEKGNLYLPSLKGYIIDIYDADMKYKKSLIPVKELKTFLFFNPPACVIYRFAIPCFSNMRYDWLSTKELFLINLYDLSITIIDTGSGKATKKFYAWDDYILSEFKIKIKIALDRIGKTSLCSYASIIVSTFVDNHDNIYLQCSDSNANQFLYKFSRDGELLQVYIIEKSDIDGIPKFFQSRDHKFYSYSDYGIHVFKEKEPGDK